MPEKESMRLDQILLEEGLITEEQIVKALEHQKKYGGKFGSQLLYLKFINETILVKALSKQYRTEGVLLTKLDIPADIIKYIPLKLAASRKLIPFAYDKSKNILKIACEDPTDKGLIEELKFITRGKKVKLYLAAELAINTSIAKHYLGRTVTESYLWELPPLDEMDTVDNNDPDPLSFSPQTQTKNASRGTILLVTDESDSLTQLITIFESDGFLVRTTDSANEAINMLEGERFHSVFIKDTVSGDYIDLIDRLRKKSPRTVVRYYESTSSLLLEDTYLKQQENLLIHNLELFTSLLASKEKLPVNHSGIVGDYVKRLCNRLGLPAKERTAVINAAYIHDMGRYYADIDDEKDFRKHIDQTVKFLQSVNYSPVVIEMLKSMYIDLNQKYTKRLPIEVLGGNILTLVDLFCENITINERLTLDKLETLKKKIHDLIGTLFLKELVKPFIDMIQDDIFSYQAKTTGSQIMMLVDPSCNSTVVEMQLKNDGFRTFCLNDIDNFVKLYKRSRPDIIVLMGSDDKEKLVNLVFSLMKNGIDINDVPAFMLVNNIEVAELSHLLSEGIEDIIDYNKNLDLFSMKLRRIHNLIMKRIEEDEVLKHAPSHTNGRLPDMNLIDLLQAMGPGQRTIKITITPNEEPTNDKLYIYLNKGQICYALYGELTGAEAVYRGVSWSDGTWLVEPVEEQNLPDPNNELSNESILMEGCRLLDEHTRRLAIKMQS